MPCGHSAAIRPPLGGVGRHWWCVRWVVFSLTVCRIRGETRVLFLLRAVWWWVKTLFLCRVGRGAIPRPVRFAPPFPHAGPARIAVKSIRSPSKTQSASRAGRVVPWWCGRPQKQGADAWARLRRCLRQSPLRNRRRFLRRISRRTTRFSRSSPRCDP